MITKDEVLLILLNDPWFSPSKSEEKIAITNKDGNVIEVPKSYYHTYDSGDLIIIRISEHGTSLNTWIKRKTDPSESLQNLSVVFSNEPVSSRTITEPVRIQDKFGNIFERYLYFVIEQYVYRMENMSTKDFTKFIKRIKSLDGNKVFTDPFKKKPKKRARRNVLTPQTMDGKDIPSTNNPVNPRQAIVANNKDYEVDAEGNVIKDWKLRSNGKCVIRLHESDIRRIVSDIINEIITQTA